MGDVQEHLRHAHVSPVPVLGAEGAVRLAAGVGVGVFVGGGVGTGAARARTAGGFGGPRSDRAVCTVCITAAAVACCVLRFREIMVGFIGIGGVCACGQAVRVVVAAQQTRLAQSGYSSPG